MIFLAELGDKTQIAAFSITSRTRATWPVFLGAFFALSFAALLAVLFGKAASSVLPPEYARTIAGTLFLVFGAALLVVRGKKTLRDVLASAMKFEQALEFEYRRLAADAAPEIRAAIDEIVRQEKAHDEYLAALSADQSRIGNTAWRDEFLGEKVWENAVHFSRPSGADPAAVMANLADMEDIAAGFYGLLARETVDPEMREVFERFAGEERRHAERLRGRVSGEAAG